MVKKPVKPERPLPAESILPLVQEIRDLVQSSRRAAAQNVNTLLGHHQFRDWATDR